MNAHVTHTGPTGCQDFCCIWNDEGVSLDPLWDLLIVSLPDDVEAKRGKWSQRRRETWAFWIQLYISQASPGPFACMSQ